MKHCPKCSADYFDNMIEFCLEDGTKLSDVSTARATRPDTRQQTESFLNDETETVVTTQPTEGIPIIKPTSNSLDPARQTHEILSKSNKLKETVRNKWHTTLEFAPIIIALAHNYWQWLYLSRQNYYQFFDYLLSVNFVVWFVLLITGIIFGIISLKYGRSKSFAITALVVLAVNLILFIVPK